jgi:hypothetical protein
VYPQLVAESVELRPLTKPPVRATHRHRHRRRDEVLVGVDRRAGAMIELTAPIGAQVGDDAPILQVRGGRPMDQRASWSIWRSPKCRGTGPGHLR